jgi:hypothetical protein
MSDGSDVTVLPTEVIEVCVCVCGVCVVGQIAARYLVK